MDAPAAKVGSGILSPILRALQSRTFHSFIHADIGTFFFLSFLLDRLLLVAFLLDEMCRFHFLEFHFGILIAHFFFILFARISK